MTRAAVARDTPAARATSSSVATPVARLGTVGPPGCVESDLRVAILSVTQAVQQRVLAARTGVAAVFALNGLAVASWFARIPSARDALGLTPGRLGVLLLVLSAGSLLGM